VLLSTSSGLEGLGNPGALGVLDLGALTVGDGFGGAFNSYGRGRVRES